MGRKPDPRGKDRPRTIVLAGDVAEIAQKLADKGTLSATLSDLLRQQYGFGEQLEERKRALTMLLDEKDRLTALTQAMADEIDELEEKTLAQNATIRPALERRLDILHSRREKLSNELGKFSFLLSPNELLRKQKAAAEVDKLIREAQEELEALN